MVVKFLGAESQRALETHGFSRRQLADYPDLCLCLLQVKEACAFANWQLGYLSGEDFTAIQAAIQALHQDLPAWFIADPWQGGGGVGLHMNLNEAIAQQLGQPDWIGKISLHQSSTDVCGSAMNIALQQRRQSCLAILTALIESLTSQAARHSQTVTIGKTCLRDAGPIAYADRLDSWAASLQRQLNLLASWQPLTWVNLGGTALGTGEGIPAEDLPAYRELARTQLSALCQLALINPVSFTDSVQNRDDLLQLASAMDNLGLVLIKIARDIRLLASGPAKGFQEISLPRIIKGSSFYPNKVNPTLEETLIQCGCSIHGLCEAVKLSLTLGEIDMNVYYLYAGFLLLDCFDWLNNLLPKYLQFNLQALDIHL